MNEHIHWGKIAVLVVAIAGIGVVGYFIGKGEFIKTVSRQEAAPIGIGQSSNSEKKQKTVENVPVRDATESMNVYSNTKYKYTFQYPKHYSLLDMLSYTKNNLETASNIGLISETSTDACHAIKVSTENLQSLVDFHENQLGINLRKKSNIIFHGVNAVQFDYVLTSGYQGEAYGYGRTIVFSVDGNTYELTGNVEYIGKPGSSEGVCNWDFSDVLNSFQLTK